MERVSKRILWVDDEVELLEPHRLVLDRQGYVVDTTTNGDDALVMLRRHAYDLVLLDERMPGRTGLEVLDEVRRAAPHVRVVMVTKSEENRTLEQAIGRRVDDYLVKPASPRQVLSVVKRLLEGRQLRQRQTARDLAGRFAELSAARDRAGDWNDYARLYGELVDWDLRLEETGEAGLADTVHALLADTRREYGDHVVREYQRWVHDRAGAGERPMLSTDIVARRLVPMLESEPVFLVVIDCMRLDQWRSVRALVASDFDIDEELYCGILPTATPYARNAIFSGRFPDRIARDRPGWWEIEDGSLNAFEDELLAEQLERLTGRSVPVHYEKIFTGVDTDALIGRIRGAVRRGGVIALVFNFVDMLTHGRTESAILMEVARDERALRALTRQWFERSAISSVLREVAANGANVLLTSDHGSILCERPATVYAGRDASDNLRYKFGGDLRAENPTAIFLARDESVLRVPAGPMAMTYMLAREDYYFVYPTKLREYQARYRGSFLHGGVSPEEMILPLARLTPRRGGGGGTGGAGAGAKGGASAAGSDAGGGAAGG